MINRNSNKVLLMELSEFTKETRAKLNDLLKYWKKWEHVKDHEVLQLLDSIATSYGGKVVDRQIVRLAINIIKKMKIPQKILKN